MDIRPLSEVNARLDLDSQARLIHILQRSVKGDLRDWQSPLYNKRPRKEIADMCGAVIGEFGHPEMNAIDKDEYDNIGPYSPRLPWDQIKEAVYAYFNNAHPSYDIGAFERARRRFMSILPPRSLRLASWEEALERLPRGTNLGYPTFSSDEKFVNLYLERALALKSADDIGPFVTFWRGQPNGTPIPKQRTVMGGDHLDTLAWERVLIPLLPALRMVPGYSAWSTPDDVDVALTELLTYGKRNSRIIVSGDHSKYDAHLISDIINVVFDAYEYWFEVSASWLINILRESFLHKGLICPDGLLEGRDGAVMSGTGGTNNVDGNGNHFASLYVAERARTQLERIQIMGDDFVSIWKDDLYDDLEDLMAEIGLVTNKDKQFISDRSCHYLQRWHSMDYMIDNICRGVRSPYRSLNGMMSHERRVSGWNEYMESARWIMQGEMVRWDKRFSSFVRFIKEGDEVLRSGMDPVEIFQRAGGSEKIRRTLRIASFPFNVKRPEGVETFAITSVLRSL